MKHLTILVLLLLIGCTTTNDCDCVQETYEWENVELESGAMVCSFPELTKTINVPCQDEVYEVTSDTTYIIIKCYE